VREKHPFPVRDGIVIMQKCSSEQIDPGGRLLDIWALRKSRLYYGRRIESEVEYSGRLHSVDFVRLHATLLGPHLHNSVLVDMGCGQCPYVEAFHSSQVKVYYGLDLNMESLMLARQNIQPIFPVVLISQDVMNPPFAPQTADAVISSEVLEHLREPVSYLRKINRLLKPGGLLSISTPCVSQYWYPYKLISCILRPWRIARWWRNVNAHHFWYDSLSSHPALWPSVLRNWLRKTGFKVVSLRTTLWYYHTPLKPIWRLFRLMEQAGINWAVRTWKKVLSDSDKILAAGIPLVKWMGIRQFALCRKVLQA
jgi:SAM-dependent methyltransferase